METPVNEGGNDVEPDALSYSLVIHSWLRGCRGNSNEGGKNNSNGRRSSSSSLSSTQHRRKVLTDIERIEQAMVVVDRLEAWVRKTRDGGAPRRIDESADNNDEDEDDMLDLYDGGSPSQQQKQQSTTKISYNSYRQHNKARDLDVEVYNSILVAYSREQSGDHSARVMRILDRMESLADALDMPSVRPNMKSYNIALGVVSKNNASRANTSLKGYYNDIESSSTKNVVDKDGKISGKHKLNPVSDKKKMPTKKDRNNKQQQFNPLYAGKAAESILGRMLGQRYRPDAYTFASVLNTYQRIPNGKLDAALAADAVVRGMESLHLHGKIDEPPDVFHYTMVCACWSRSGEQGVAGERCSEILRHMQERDEAGFPRVQPNIRTFNAVIDSHAYNGRVAEAEDMLLSMVDNYESSAARSMDGIEDENLPVRPDAFSFNTVIQQWARSRSPDGGRRAEYILDRMLKFHYDGNADVRPDERSFAYIIYHYTKGAGRTNPKSPDRALKLLQKMIGMYKQGYSELLPVYNNKTNPIFAFTSVIDAHSVLRRSDSGLVGEELFNAMSKLGEKIEALRPNTYACLSVLYGWSSCGSVEAGERATNFLQQMEDDMDKAVSRGEESMMRTTQRCYILAQTAWARSPSEHKAEGALKVLEMMEQNYDNGNLESKPTVQAYSMVLNACAFADMVQDDDGRMIKASPAGQQLAFEIAQHVFDRICNNKPYGVTPNPVIYGTLIKCCGRLDLPDSDVAVKSAMKAFRNCCRAGQVSDFVLTQLRYALRPEQFLAVLVKNGYKDLDRNGKRLSRDGRRFRNIRVDELPPEWTVNGRSR